MKTVPISAPVIDYALTVHLPATSARQTGRWPVSSQPEALPVRTRG